MSLWNSEKELIQSNERCICADCTNIMQEIQRANKPGFVPHTCGQGRQQTRIGENRTFRGAILISGVLKTFLIF